MAIIDYYFYLNFAIFVLGVILIQNFGPTYIPGELEEARKILSDRRNWTWDTWLFEIRLMSLILTCGGKLIEVWVRPFILGFCFVRPALDVVAAEEARVAEDVEALWNQLPGPAFIEKVKEESIALSEEK
ncbi:hypothetical protein BDZ45DRAFT_736795 [Acephala macrosclerotiorum]|nr:hypothetical protein BDZ45DRAFT_736795 [Acephala macrosclerotiorum]